MKTDIFTFDRASNDFRWATTVAAFAEQLKGGEHLGEFGYDAILKLAISAKGEDEFGYRAEMTRLVRMAQQISSNG
jgi:Ca-activated chloride channel family protein